MGGSLRTESATESSYSYGQIFNLKAGGCDQMTGVYRRKVFIFILDFSEQQSDENIENIRRAIEDFTKGIDTRDFVQIILQNNG